MSSEERYDVDLRKSSEWLIIHACTDAIHGCQRLGRFIKDAQKANKFTEVIVRECPTHATCNHGDYGVRMPWRSGQVDPSRSIPMIMLPWPIDGGFQNNKPRTRRQTYTEVAKLGVKGSFVRALSDAYLEYLPYLQSRLLESSHDSTRTRLYSIRIS